MVVTINFCRYVLCLTYSKFICFAFSFPLFDFIGSGKKYIGLMASFCVALRAKKVCVCVCFEGEGDLITFDKSQFFRPSLFFFFFRLDRLRPLSYLLSLLMFHMTCG